MRKRNVKKRTVYTVLLIVIAVLIVGYAALSATLNIFGGLSIVGGNSFAIHWNNIVINEDSTAEATTEPIIASTNGGASNTVNFVVNLTTPGQFYEFNVDAVNTGSIDAMVYGIEYRKLDSNGDPANADFLECSVSYSNDIQLSSGQLLAAGGTATYKVRVAFSSDVSGDELPSGEEAYTFEFSVTYVQADESAYVPGASSLPEIPNATNYGSDISDGTYYRLNTEHVSLYDSAYEIGTVFTNRNDIPDTNGFDFALKHTISTGDVSSVGLTFRYNGNFYDFAWNSNIFNDTTKGTLSSIFNGQCDDYEDLYLCSDGDSADVQFYSDSSITVGNGAYTCTINADGESYCIGG